MRRRARLRASAAPRRRRPRRLDRLALLALLLALWAGAVLFLLQAWADLDGQRADASGPSVILVDSGGRAPRLRRPRTVDAGATCESASLGPYLSVDSDGFVCPAALVEGGCCQRRPPESAAAPGAAPELARWRRPSLLPALVSPAERAALRSLPRHSCGACDLEGPAPMCCAAFEACVACCLGPRGSGAREAVALGTANFALRRAAERSTFAFCVYKCRSSSAAVVTENSYRSDVRYCFGPFRPAVAKGAPVGSVLLGAAAEDATRLTERQRAAMDAFQVGAAEVDPLMDAAAAEALRHSAAGGAGGGAGGASAQAPVILSDGGGG